MKNRWVQAVTAICAFLLLSGGIVYMMKDQKHQRAKKRYDAYTAQLDAYVEKHGLPLLSEDSAAYDAIVENAEQARAYLLKHAPHLLPSEINVDTPYSRAGYIAYLREVDPEAAAQLESRLAEVEREYESEKARIDAEADRFEQEHLDHVKDMEMFAKQRQTSSRERLASERERAASRERLDHFIAELRSHLILDSNGKMIGIKDDSIFSISERPSALPSGKADADVPADRSVTSYNALESSRVASAAPEAESATSALSPVDDPVLWRENVKTQMAGLHNGFYEKYPDVMIRPHLSDTEYQKLFPDAASRQQLHQRTDALQTEYANRIRAVLDKTPQQRKTALLEMAREALSTQWNADFAQSVLDQLSFDDK